MTDWTDDKKYVSRDCFGRYDIYRDKKPSGECAWCGSPKGYRYYVWHDGGRKDESSKLFCSKSCMKTCGS